MLRWCIVVRRYPASNRRAGRGVDVQAPGSSCVFWVPFSRCKSWDGDKVLVAFPES